MFFFLFRTLGNINQTDIGSNMLRTDFFSVCANELFCLMPVINWGWGSDFERCGRLPALEDLMKEAVMLYYGKCDI